MRVQQEVVHRGYGNLLQGELTKIREAEPGAWIAVKETEVKETLSQSKRLVVHVT